MTDVDDELKEIFEEIHEADKKLEEELREFIKKFSNFEQLCKDAADVIDYYFSIQNTYKKKGEFVRYLKGLFGIYISYIQEAYDSEDEEIDNIIDFIEDNYDFLVYFGEDVNPVYKRIHSPDCCSVRKQLGRREKKRLALILEEQNYKNCTD